MGGKTSTSTQDVSIPPAVLAQYQSVNDAASSTAQTPFNQYGGEFVAPVNDQQVAGIIQTDAAANEAQPYYGAATGVVAGAQAGVNPVNAAALNTTAASSAPLTGSQIDQYLSPYLGEVLGSTEALQNISNQQQQGGQLGDAIRSGAFGGDRTGIAAANLEQQQNLTNANVISGIANTGYQSALSTAQGQQQIGLAAGAQEANIGSTAYGEGANTANTLANLGTGAQTAGLTGASAEIGAGTVEQQTQQAQDTAEYNQFLQQQSYPFQVDQFLANIAEGTGALSGSTTTTQQPGGFFSDERLKEDMEPIGKTFDGQTIYRYKMKGDPRTRIGLSAQKVEKKHPEAVGVAGGFRVVDYGKATEKAANDGHFHEGGIVPFRRARAVGGTDDGLTGVLEAQRNMYSGIMGGPQQQRQMPEGGGTHQLAVASGTPSPPPSGQSNVTSVAGDVQKGYQLYKHFNPSTSAGNGLSAADNASLNAGVAADASTAGDFTGAAVGASDAAGGTLMAGGTDAAVGAGLDAGATAAAAEGAGSLAVAGGTEIASTAAAEYAAAIAAEYALADVAVAGAVMAAKRGGRIRQGLDIGGAPYGGADDIPNDPNQYKLQAAGPIKKIPTGFQTMMTMGNPQDWGSLMGSTFSNEALATGGVAGRKHYADGGGDVTPDDLGIAAPDPDAAPDATGAPASGLAAAPVSAAAPANADAKAPSKSSTWDKIKDFATSPGGLAILRGIGAMGTAKTVHPGVALAAGLGEGAEAYPQIQSEQALAHTRTAEAAQTEALTAGQQQTNTMLGLRAGAMARSLAPPSAPTAPAVQAPPQPAAPTDKAQAINNGIYKEYQSKYLVNSAQTPEEQANIDQAAQADSAIGGGWTGNSVKANNDFQNRVAGDKVQKVAAARQEAEGLYATATDKTADYATRQAALARYNVLEQPQFTGVTYSTVGGNKQVDYTGAPAIGRAAPIPTPAQRAEFLSQAREFVNQPQSDGTYKQVPTWLAQHAPSDQAYADLMANFAMAGTPDVTANAAPGVPGAAPAPAPAQTPPASRAPPAAAAAAATPPARTAAPVQAPANAQGGDQYMSRALTDQAYRIPPTPAVSGSTQSPQIAGQKKMYQEQASQVAKEASEATAAASLSLQYSKAAKAILDAKQVDVGAYGGLINSLSRWFPGEHIDASNYVTLAKYLGNAAVQAGRANFNNPTQGEVGLQLNELSPHTGMPESAIADLLKTNIKSAQYTIDSAQRTNAYLTAGADGVPLNKPLGFSLWNQKYFPREKVIAADQIRQSRDGRRIYHINGQWVQ